MSGAGTEEPTIETTYDDLRSRITDILTSPNVGDPSHAEELFPLVYTELHGLAERYLRREAEGHTLQPTRPI